VLDRTSLLHDSSALAKCADAHLIIADSDAFKMIVVSYRDARLVGPGPWPVLGPWRLAGPQLGPGASARPGGPARATVTSHTQAATVRVTE
jgi:hypothetical protein